jgi:hypothetical protein
MARSRDKLVMSRCCARIVVMERVLRGEVTRSVSGRVYSTVDVFSIIPCRQLKLRRIVRYATEQHLYIMKRWRVT